MTMTLSNRRVPAVVALAILVGGLVVLGNVAVQVPKAKAARTITNAPAVLAAGAVRSAAWYCPMATPAATIPSADGIQIANLETKIVVVDVSLIGGGDVIRRRRVDVGGRSTTFMAMSEFGSKRQGAILVESFGPGIVVEHLAQMGSKAALTPCATESSSRWYFAAGSTRKSVVETIALANPFGQSATIDISLLTVQGALRPGSLQGIEVEARGRTAINVNRGADQREVLAVEVVARGGTRVVAELAMAGIGDSAALTPLSLMVGAPAADTQWHLVDVDTDRDTKHEIVVMNPADTRLAVSVQTLVDGEHEVSQRDLTVEPRSVAIVDPRAIASSKRDMTVIVYARSTFIAGDLIVAGERTKRFAGSAVAAASNAISTRSVFGLDRTEQLNDALIVVENVNDEPVTIEIRVGGASVSQRAIIPGNERKTIKLRSNTISMPVIVVSDLAVSVSRRLSGAAGTSRSIAIPTL